MKDLEVLERRHESFENVKPYIGTYYSNRWARVKILGQTEEFMTEMDEEIKKESKDEGGLRTTYEPTTLPSVTPEEIDDLEPGQRS